MQDLKDEIVKNEKVLKEQISAAEEQSHNSYIKMRTAVRECDEHKREKEIYRKRLLDIDMSPQFKKTSTPLSSKTSSERAVSPTNSNKSSEFCWLDSGFPRLKTPQNFHNLQILNFLSF